MYVRDEESTAAARITLTPGPRVTLESFEIRGLPPESIGPLKAEWRHPTGEFYDALYVNDYLKAARVGYPAVFKAFPSVSVEVTPTSPSAVAVALTFGRDSDRSDGPDRRRLRERVARIRGGVTAAISRRRTGSTRRGRRRA